MNDEQNLIRPAAVIPAPHRRSKITDDGTKTGYGLPVVSVSAVAREWGISSRRVRVMLAEGRLDGRQLDNGYWEVCYPYRYVFGTRGPAFNRGAKTIGKRKRPEPIQEHTPCPI